MENKIISTDDIQEYIASQIQTIRACAQKFNLLLLSSYLELAEQILDEELHPKN